MLYLSASVKKDGVNSILWEVCKFRTGGRGNPLALTGLPYAPYFLHRSGFWRKFWCSLLILCCLASLVVDLWAGLDDVVVGMITRFSVAWKGNGVFVLASIFYSQSVADITNTTNTSNPVNTTNTTKGAPDSHIPYDMYEQLVEGVRWLGRITDVLRKNRVAVVEPSTDPQPRAKAFVNATLSVLRQTPPSIPYVAPLSHHVIMIMLWALSCMRSVSESELLYSNRFCIYMWGTVFSIERRDWFILVGFPVCMATAYSQYQKWYGSALEDFMTKSWLANTNAPDMVFLSCFCTIVFFCGLPMCRHALCSSRNALRTVYCHLVSSILLRLGATMAANAVDALTAFFGLAFMVSMVFDTVLVAYSIHSDGAGLLLMYHKRPLIRRWLILLTNVVVLVVISWYLPIKHAHSSTWRCAREIHMDSIVTAFQKVDLPFVKGEIQAVLLRYLETFLPVRREIR